LNVNRVRLLCVAWVASMRRFSFWRECTMASAFEEFFKRAVEHEGKVCEDVPGDRGGPTKWGITIGRYADIKGMPVPRRGTDAFYEMKSQLFKLSEAEIKEIYRRDYWDAVRADELPPGMNLAVADFGLNSGPSRAVKVLQKILGNPQTGRMDNETISESHAFDRVELIILYCDERQRFLNAIVTSNPSQRKFLKGWTTRVGDVRRAALAMADKAKDQVPVRATMPKADDPHPPPQAAPTVAGEAVKSKSVWLLLSVAAGKVGDFFFGLGDAATGMIGRAVDVLKATQTEADDAIAPLVSLGERLKLNVGNIALWVTVGTLIIVVIRHAHDKA